MFPTSSEVKREQVRAITKSINKSLESSWSKKQLVNGKWFPIKTFWLPAAIQELMMRYRSAGWVVSRHVELESKEKGTTHYIVIGHPKHHTPKAASN